MPEESGARITGMAKAVEDLLGEEVNISEDPQIADCAWSSIDGKGEIQK